MKSIPAPLQAHKDLSSTTLCRLLKFSLRDGTIFGITSLNEDVEYDDAPLDSASSAGPVVYQAACGYEPSPIDASSDLAVDNSEARGLIPQFDMGVITPAMISSGRFDYAEWIEYQVNYRDLSMGHEILGSGRTGRIRRKQDLEYQIEKRSLSQELKQTIVELDSITCRAKFGSQPLGTGGGVVEQLFPCGKPLTWYYGTVESVGAESDRTFTDSSLEESSGSPATLGADFFVPGVVLFQTGDNAGREYEIEAFTAGGQVTLAFPTEYPVQENDEYLIRQDCSQKARDAEHGCLYHWGTEWVLHFRGEPDIPVADEGLLGIPGAGL